MNRFDRVTSILLLLQTRSVVTAGFLAEHFSVSERTIYRDIRTLENAGVPIGSEAGVGYFLDKGYHLPPVSFTLDEAASLLIGEKLLVSSLDPASLQDYKHLLNKVRAVLDVADKDYLNSLDADIEVLYEGQAFVIDGESNLSGIGHDLLSSDLWLGECRSALVRRQVVEVDYCGPTSQQATSRHIEPIGLFYYSLHWHLIAWCCLREGYRDFRLDRILKFQPQPQQFTRRSRATLQQYLARQQSQNELLEVELLFRPEAAGFVGEQRYTFGFVSEENTAEGVKMRFLTAVPHYMARWLLQFTDGVSVLKGDGLTCAMRNLSEELSAHWKASL
ncbi:MAG: YafY family transcriptional regulator [Pseudomonadales bacterium]|nr:YafY family transcriptional regulator [Pseudomonadales bacterium]NRA14817.1 YafY family transcriptional regulator [Oceanospirillaceae bacterium]